MAKQSKRKIKHKKLKFSLKQVSEKRVLKTLKSMKNKESAVVYISTSVWVLRTPKAGRNIGVCIELRNE